MFKTITTLGELHNPPGWLWLYCARLSCTHKRAVAIAPFVIRWGPSAPVSTLKRNAVCQLCGHRGAVFSMPAWVDMVVGEERFPVDSDTEGLRGVANHGK